MTKELKYPSSFEIKDLLVRGKIENIELCQDLASKLSKILIAKNISIAFAESVTGGLLMSELVRTPGISSVLKGGVVCYTAKTKIDLLGVSPQLIEKHTCESQRVSTAIAEGIKDRAKSKLAVGITGLASQGASETLSKPIGSIFLSVIYLGKDIPIIYTNKRE